MSEALEGGPLQRVGGAGMTTGGELTDLLNAWAEGSEEAREAAVREIYPEMRRVAARLLAREHGNVSLQATELAHETYLRLAKEHKISWQNRRHFLAVTATVVRRVLIDHCRHKFRQRRGGGAQRVDLETVSLSVPAESDAELLAIDEALTRLAATDPTAVRLVELRFFGGLTVTEAASCLGIGRSSAVSIWQYARAWLKESLEPVPCQDPPSSGSSEVHCFSGE